MDKFDELLEKLNGLEIKQQYIDWEDNIPQDIWGEHFKDNFKILDTKLNVDTHRWYERSITVIEIYNKLLGINHISNIFSETLDCDDIGLPLNFYEMEEVQIISYIKK